MNVIPARTSIINGYLYLLGLLEITCFELRSGPHCKTLGEFLGPITGNTSAAALLDPPRVRLYVASLLHQTGSLDLRINHYCILSSGWSASSTWALSFCQCPGAHFHKLLSSSQDCTNPTCHSCFCNFCTNSDNDDKNNEDCCWVKIRLSGYHDHHHYHHHDHDTNLPPIIGGSRDPGGKVRLKVRGSSVTQGCSSSSLSSSSRSSSSLSSSPSLAY